jgi:peptidoglycan/LPS O-acetylase OafA/YrhL
VGGIMTELDHPLADLTSLQSRRYPRPVEHEVHAPTPPPPSSTKRLRGIEGLRAIAAGMIVLVHVWGFSSPDGDALGFDLWIGDALSTLSVGVTLFFTLSGFLLYRPFVAAIARDRQHMSIRAYLRNRALRIAPAYWVILFACAVVIGTVYLRDGAVLEVGRLTNPFEFLQAALLLNNYRPTTLGIGIGPAWSLAVELVFYLVLPLLVLGAAWLARRAAGRRGRVLALLGPPLLLLVVGLTGKLVAGHVFPAAPTAGYGNNWHSVVERSFWAQADLFCFGMVVAVAYVQMADGRLRLPANWRPIAVALGLLIFIPSAATMGQGEQSYLLQNTGQALALALVFAAIVMPYGAETPPTRAIRVLESPLLVSIGVVSYSVFLWHLPVIVWLSAHGLTLSGWGGLVINAAIVTVVVGALSALTYHFVERPALRRKRSMRTPEPAPRGAGEQPAIGAPATEPAI